MILLNCAKKTHNNHMEKSQIIKRLGERVRELRKAKGLSSDKLAELIGREGSFIRRLETGRLKNIPEDIEKIAQALGVSVAELLSSPEEKKQEKTPEELLEEYAWRIVNEVAEAYEKKRKKKVSDKEKQRLFRFALRALKNFSEFSKDELLMILEERRSA